MTILYAIGIFVICGGLAIAGGKLVDLYMEWMGGHSMNDL